MNRFKNERGYSLLEVIIAMTIMTVAFASILSSQSGSLITSIKTKEMNIAGWLAHQKMIETEHIYEGRAFSELPELASPKAFDAPFERFTWTREFKEVAFPDLLQSAGGDKPQAGVPETARVLSKNLSTFFNKNVREVIVTVRWKRKDTEQKLEIVTYFVDLNAEFNFEI